MSNTEDLLVAESGKLRRLNLRNDARMAELLSHTMGLTKFTDRSQELMAQINNEAGLLFIGR